MTNKPNIKIFIAYHKESPIIKNDCLIPIQVGRTLVKEKLDMIGDDTGDNISNKNSNYCELTALYWAWKNINADYYGLFHYRRLFDFLNNGSPFFYDFSKKTRNQFGWNNETIQKYCKNYDVISAPIVDVHPPNQSRKKISIYKLYKISHQESDLKKTLEIIKNNYPEYYKTAKKYISGKKSSYFNMIIMKKEIFKDYCQWLFSILFELEKQINISKDPYQSRVFGFLAERLLNIYVRKLEENKNIKIKQISNISEGKFN